MVKRPFFSLAKPKLRYGEAEALSGGVKALGLPAEVSLLVKGCDVGGIDLKVGRAVKTGERLRLSDDPFGYVISPVTGKVSGIGEYRGYLNEGYLSISIGVDGEDDWDEGTLEVLKSPTYEGARGYLGSIPGKGDFSSLLRRQPPVNTVVVTGMDGDIGVLTQQLMVRSEGLEEGIEYLRKVTKTGRVVLVVGAGSGLSVSGVEVRELKAVYPNGVCGMIAREVLAEGYIAGRGLGEQGLGVVGAEAVMGLYGLFGRGEFPVDKVVTVVGKDGVPMVVKVRIGTPVKDILDALGIETAHGDRLILGGPMKGVSVYSDRMPVMWDTDAVMVQDRSQVVLSSDVQCINCGECVRVCPVKMPVNMLLRLLGRSLYEEAAESYDLDCCIECGLCSYVCVAGIPVFHHIMLGKHELNRLRNVEGSNA